MLKHIKKWALPLLICLALAVMLILALQPPVLQVELAAVERRDILLSVQEQGRTRGRDPYVIAAPVAGRLLRTSFNEGDTVIRGQLLAHLALARESPRTEAVLRAELAAAEARQDMVRAELNEAESALGRARREQERRATLLAGNLISREESESFNQVLEVAAARVARLSAAMLAAAAEAESARSRLLGASGDDEDFVQNIFSPVDGTIYRIHERNERVVPAGTPLLEISNEDRLEIVVDLLTQEAVRVAPGQSMLVDGWGGEQILEARVRYVEPEAFTKFSALGVEEQRVNVIADFIDSPDGLGAEYRIEASIITSRIENALTVPASAIFQRSGNWHVYVLEDGRAVSRQIGIGARNQQYAEVLDALSEGELVVLFPSAVLEEGIRLAY